MSNLHELLQLYFQKGVLFHSQAKYVDCISEQDIRHTCWLIRSKQDWITKLSDPEIIVEWKKAQEQRLTDREIDYVFEEVAYHQKLCGDSNVVLSAVEQVWQSDESVVAETQNELKEYVKILEDVPDRFKDWESGSNYQVLNLTDPSLYPIVYGHTFILSEPIPSPQAALDIESFGKCPAKLEDWDVYPKGDNIWESEDERELAAAFLSHKFCWLPTEFMVGEDGSATIESYINNLHPVRHAKLYPVIASIFSKFIPMLEQVVTDLVHLRQKRVTPDFSNLFEYDRPEPKMPNNATEEEYEEYEMEYEEWLMNRDFIRPQPNEFVVPDRPLQPYSLRNRRLQAIVKMANIYLTPGMPKYKDDDWREHGYWDDYWGADTYKDWYIDGMANERIIATGIYYYDVENITGGRLSFREPLIYSVDPVYDDEEAIEEVFGIVQGCDTSQNIGYVEIKQGRCLVYPNIYQHRLSGFKMADPTKPGHCKMLIFYFVDPSTTIPSTEYVPPQQQDWWAEKVMDFSTGGALGKLPDLVKDNILRYVDYPMSLKEAKKVGLKLREEHMRAYLSKLQHTFSPNWLP